MSILNISEKVKTRDRRNLAVEQWLRSMPENNETDLETDIRYKTPGADREEGSISNITIKVEKGSDTDKTHGDEQICNRSSLNSFSTKPLQLHGSQCRMNYQDDDSRKRSRRVKFDIKSDNENSDEAEKQVKYDIIIRTAEEDNAELKRSMTKYLMESVARKSLKNENIQNKTNKTSKYVVNEDERECHMDSGFHKYLSSAGDSRSTSRSRKSSYSIKEFDDVIFDRHTLHIVSPGHLQRVQSGNLSTRSTWSPGKKRVYRQKPKTVYLKYSSGTQEIQTPVIKGLVVDVVENQKPSVVRASKNANIREEFALRQKVEGYRACCSQNVNSIIFAQRKLSAKLINLHSRMVACSRANDKHEDGHFCVKTLSDELFSQSKGYFLQAKPGSSAYNFPPLTYPKRRVLTIG